MTSEILDSFRKNLPSLDAGELDQIIALASFLKKGKPSQKSVANEESMEHILFEVMQDVLLDNHIKIPHFNYFKKTPAYKKFKENMEFVSGFFDKGFAPRRLTRVKRRKLYRMVMELLIISMKEAGITITSNSFTTMLKNIPSIIQTNFPGYIESGLLFMMVDSQGVSAKHG